jgi:hypothetical protein
MSHKSIATNSSFDATTQEFLAKECELQSPELSLRDEPDRNEFLANNMPSQSPELSLRTSSQRLDAIASQLDALTQDELLEVKAMVDALLEARDAKMEEFKPERDGGQLKRARGCGHIEIKMIPDKKRGKTYGPYKYLRYWMNGKLRTRYLGKVEEFRRHLIINSP